MLLWQWQEIQKVLCAESTLNVVFAHGFDNSEATRLKILKFTF